MDRQVNEENIRRSNVKSFFQSNIFQFTLIYIALIIVALDIPVFIKILIIAGCLITNVVVSLLNMRILRSSDDVIDQLNGEFCNELLEYCAKKYKTNDSNEPLKFYFTSNADESLIYLNCCIMDTEGKDLEDTKVTMMELWRFQKTDEFLSKPVSFLTDEKNRLLDTAKNGVDEFFNRFKEFLNKK